MAQHPKIEGRLKLAMKIGTYPFFLCLFILVPLIISSWIFGGSGSDALFASILILTTYFFCCAVTIPCVILVRKMRNNAEISVSLQRLYRLSIFSIIAPPLVILLPEIVAHLLVN